MLIKPQLSAADVNINFNYVRFRLRFAAGGVL